jgi:hypothetical protein
MEEFNNFFFHRLHPNIPWGRPATACRMDRTGLFQRKICQADPAFQGDERKNLLQEPCPGQSEEYFEHFSILEIDYTFYPFA